jgi:parallel beta-helix repeat protein
LPISAQQNKVRPTAGHRTDGWAENEEPPCNFENYNGFSIFEFLQFFDLNAIRSATAIVVADDATDPMKDMATAEGTGLNKWLCDGISDGIQIQAAVDAVEAAGGGIVLLSEGTFELITPIIIDSDNVAMIGMGRGATILKVSDSAAIQFDVLTLDTVSDCMVRDIEIDGNDANQAGVLIFGGIVTDDTTHAVIERVSVHDLYDGTGGTPKGIEIKGAASSSVVVRDCRVFSISGVSYSVYITGGALHTVSNSRILDGAYITAAECKIVNCYAEEGVEFRNGSERSQVRGCTIKNTTGSGIDIDTVSEIVAQDNVIQSPGLKGIIVDTANRCVISGNWIENAQHDGIELTSVDDSMIIGNRIGECSQAADNTHAGIAVETGCNDLTIVGNQVRDGVAPLQQRYGFYVAAAGPVGIYTVANDFRIAGKTASLSDAGGNTVHHGMAKSWAGPVAAALADFNNI